MQRGLLTGFSCGFGQERGSFHVNKREGQCCYKPACRESESSEARPAVDEEFLIDYLTKRGIGDVLSATMKFFWR
ncbi:hypothetical protein M5K25_000411 [Dendrobium thyrsiflorum]|uniref:Uncharacterized protein n=1 Tax=Dendrobium thyrsiflorum TaxID=117978 RepID=A0ABD0VTJ8_DENTH